MKQKILALVLILVLNIGCLHQGKTDQDSCNRSFSAITAFPSEQRDKNLDLVLYAACISDSK